MSKFGQVGKKWAPEEIALLEQRLAEGVRPVQIARELGRHRSSIYERMYRGKLRKPRVSAGMVVSIVPDHVEREWRERQVAPIRDLTAAYLGDPPVGYSALERRS
jgi:IS30 family transposase